MSANKRPAKKPIKDLKPKKATAQKVKGGFVPPSPTPLEVVRDRIQKILPN